jgi:outer membrane protein assembly factor BamE (lipoprotein component of BamABCDE complex)
MNRNQLVITISALLLLSQASCATKVDTGGYVHDTDIKSQLTVGKTSKDDVRSLLGSPSSQSSFGSESWYYITDRKESVAFLKPEITEQDVTRVEFDQAGLVSKVEKYDKDDAQEFSVTKRATPTEGHTLGFFEQILGNIGRFNRPGGGSDSAAPGRKTSGGY